MSWHSNELRVIANILEDYEGVNDKSDNLRMAAAGMESMEAQIERLTAEVERLTLRWTSERPTVAADYLSRKRGQVGDGGITPLTKEELDPTNYWMNLWLSDREFAGPIAVQEPARGEEGGRC